MKATELRDLSVEELQAKATELRTELFNVRMRKETGQLESTAKLMAVRRDIARAETILREKRGAEQ